MNNPKIFCIGFHKTGTTSLLRAMKLLGYRCKGSFGISDQDISKNAHKRAFSMIDKYDVFVGHPWTVIFRDLDEKYPESKFILTLRPTEKWISSVIRHFGSETTYMRQWIYGAGCPAGNEQKYISRYEQHNSDVINHFKNRPASLLVLELTEGDGWDKLCCFLGKPVPETDFPFDNRVNEREKRLRSRKNPLSRILRGTKILLHGIMK